MVNKLFAGFVVLLLVLVFFASGCVQQETEIVSDQIELSLIAEGFNSPVELVPSPDGRLFIVDRVGVIRILDSDKTVFLDLQDKVVDLRTTFDERGLLGLAFHPDFNENGRFFVYYSAPLRLGAPEGWDHTSRISEFKISDMNKADPNSEKIILEIDEPQFNHNAGQLLFGQDSNLYIGVGDGGEANDQGLGHPDIGNGQDTSTLLGSILRIDIDAREPYAIPKDNPFVGKEGRDEIFAYGFRNPFRMSFDAETGELYVGDVGQNLWEEVDIVEKGKNYGWNIKEGTHCFSPESPDESPSECPDTGYNGEELKNPIIDYRNAGAEGGGVGLSVINGYVYRGTEMPELRGKYIFGDWSSSFKSGKGLLFIAEESGGEWSITDTIEISSFIQGFGQDLDNELYVLTSDSVGPARNTGKVYKIVQK
jgi:glucose/arabinose dehydrogenase